MPDNSPFPAPPPASGQPRRSAPVVVTASRAEAAEGLRDLLEDYRATLVASDRVEVEPLDSVRRGTVIYRVIQASLTIADRFPDCELYFHAEDGNRWRLPPPPL